MLLATDERVARDFANQDFTSANSLTQEARLQPPIVRLLPSGPRRRCGGSLKIFNERFGRLWESVISTVCVCVCVRVGNSYRDQLKLK